MPLLSPLLRPLLEPILPPPLAASGEAIPLLRDSMTDANGTALASHTPEVGGPWTNNVGAIQIQGNKAQATTLVSSEAIATIDLGAADYAIGGTLVAGAGAAACLIVRAVDASNFFMAALNVSTNKVEIYERVAGAFTLRASGGTASAGVAARIVALCQGATITVYKDGVQVAQYASATAGQTATRVGLRLTVAASTMTADDLVAWRAGAVAVPGGVV